MPVIKEELQGSPTYSLTRSGLKATQMFKIRWEDVDEMMLEVFPPPVIMAGKVIQPPSRFFPGRRWLIAETVKIEQFNPTEAPLYSAYNDVPNVYTEAKVTIDYTTPDYDTDDQSNGPGEPITFVNQKLSIGGEFLTYAPACLRWQDASDWSVTDTTPRQVAVGEDIQVGVTIPLIEHELNWPYIPFPPWSQIRLGIGKVNAYTFNGAPRECLLFIGFEASREITSAGIRMWNITYRFSEKNLNPANPLNPMGWNHFLRPDGPSAGTFMRLRKRGPSGYTTLQSAAALGAGTVTVKSGSTFPNRNFNARIGPTAIHKVTATTAANVWTLNPVLPAGLSAGAAVVQTTSASLNGGISATAKALAIDADQVGVFPAVGQYTVQVDNEEMAVTGGQGTAFLQVLRGVNGTVAKAHVDGASVQLKPGNIYDLFDFRNLFRSGIVTG